MSVGPIVDYISTGSGGADVVSVRSFYVASGSVAVGDFVAFSQPASGGGSTLSYVKAASISGTGPYLVGVALQAGTFSSGSLIQVQVGGPCDANVSSSVSSAPALIGPSATAGRAAGTFVASGSADLYPVGLALDAGSNSALTPVFLFNLLLS